MLEDKTTTFIDDTLMRRVGWLSEIVSGAMSQAKPRLWLWAGFALVVVSWVGTSLVLGWYLTSVADYGSVFGNLATVVVVLTYLYASSTTCSSAPSSTRSSSAAPTRSSQVLFVIQHQQPEFGVGARRSSVRGLARGRHSRGRESCEHTRLRIGVSARRGRERTATFSR